jgi:hypothetical protein
MRITYQGLPVLRAEFNRSPGLMPGRGFVLILREFISEIKVSYSPVPTIADKEVFWPVGMLPPPAASVTDTPATTTTEGKVRWVGDLVFDSTDEKEGSGENEVTVRRMYVDKSGMQEEDFDAFDDGNKLAVVRVNLVDSRVFWTTAGEVSGYFNVVKESGLPDPSSMTPDGTLWSYQDLLNMAVEGLATSPVLSFTDGDVSTVPPPMNMVWDHDNPAVVLRELLERGGFEIVLHLDDTVGIYRENASFDDRTFQARRSVTVPADMVEQRSESVSFNHHAAVVRVLGKRTRVNITVPMVPVFTDSDGNLRPLTNAALNDANISVGGGQRADTATLAKWVLGKPQNAYSLAPSEKLMLEDAFRTFIIAPAAFLEGSQTQAFDFSSATHPLLPMLPYMVKHDQEGQEPVEKGIRVRAMTYYEQSFENRGSLQNAIGQFIANQNVEIAFMENKVEDLGKQKADLLEKLDNLSSDELTNPTILETPSEGSIAFRTTVDTLASLGKPTFPRVQLDSAVNNFDEVRAQFRKKQTLALQGLIEKIDNAIEALESQGEAMVEYLNTVENNRTAILDNVAFREFFKLSFTAGMFRHPPGSYEVFPEKGIVKFNDPIIMMSNIGAIDPDGAEALPPDAIPVLVQFSYLLKNYTGTDRASWLYIHEPDGDVELIGKNALVNIPPRVVRNEDLGRYMGDDGAAVDAAYDTSMEAGAKATAVREFNVKRSEVGTRYKFKHFWQIEAAPPVSNIVIGTEGDVARTFVAVNDPEEPLLGYPSLRQQKEKFEELQARLVERTIRDLARRDQIKRARDS